MIKLLNKKTNTTYILSDATAIKWLKENPEKWCTAEVGVQRGAPARKVTEDVANKIIKENTPKEETNKTVPSKKEKLDVEKLSFTELKALAQRLGVKFKGQPKKDFLIAEIKKIKGE